MPLKWKAKVDDRATDYFRLFELWIELLRCQDDVVATSEMADYIQACGSFVLVVLAAGEHVQSHAETET